jgi:hypothetical protein
MANFSRQVFDTALLGIVLAMFLVAFGRTPATAVEVGDPAPNFTLPSTTGGNISLSDFRGKKWALLEFYGADFAPV